jgi:hypothetical protein
MHSAKWLESADKYPQVESRPRCTAGFWSRDFKAGYVEKREGACSGRGSHRGAAAEDVLVHAALDEALLVHAGGHKAGGARADAAGVLHAGWQGQGHPVGATRRLPIGPRDPPATR